MNNHQVMVVIPAFNEEKSISKVILEVMTYIAKDQIFVANDGSTDNTIKVVRELGVKYITLCNNNGKGFVLRETITQILRENPNVNWIITIDADGQHNHDDIPKFLSAIKSRPEMGIFVGQRDFTKMPFVNRISNLLTSKWCKFWLQWDINDLQCGFRCYNAKILQKIMKYGLKCRKFDLETEILLTAWFLDIHLSQIPISTNYCKQRRRSRITPTIDTLRWIRVVARFGFKTTFFKKMLIKRK